MLEGIGPVDSFELKDMDNAKRLKAMARFSRESDAVEATRRLNSATLPFSSGKLSLQADCSTKVKVYNSIYNAV